MMVGDPESGVAGALERLDLCLVRIVQGNDLPGRGQRLERVKVVLCDLVDTHLGAFASDHLNVIPPVGGQIGFTEHFGGGLDPGKALVLGRHLPVPDPHDAAATVDLGGKVEVDLARHHAEDAAAQRRVFRVVVRRDAGFVEIDVEVDAAAAGALADFHVGQGFGRLFDFLQFFVTDPHTLGVAGEAVEIEGNPAGPAGLPVMARHADALGVLGEGEGEIVVLPRRLRVGVLAGCGC